MSTDRSPEWRELLDRANAEYALARDEGAAFRRLALKLERRQQRRWLRPALWCAGAACAAAAFTLWALPHSHFDGASNPPPIFAAEPQRHSDPTRGTRLAPALTPPRAAPDDEQPLPIVEDPAPSVPHATAQPHALRPKPAQPKPAPPSSTEQTPVKDEDCLASARDGHPDQAEACFEHRSRGNGLSAEMALYELARLRRDVLGSPTHALDALTEYGQRFPSGSLRSEVDFSRIELLVRLGRGKDALTESEHLLATRAGAERSAELHLLRGNVYRQARELRAAEREYAAVDASSPSSKEAAQLRAQCLEALAREPH